MCSLYRREHYRTLSHRDACATGAVPVMPLYGVAIDSPALKDVQAMSALGHKRTYAVHQPMSALPPKATAKADMCQWSCLLCLRKRTCAVHSPMSALGQKRTHAAQQKGWLFDHLVGTGRSNF
jgi:hypothetical protein